MRTLLLFVLVIPATLPAADSCLDCHAKLEGNLAAPAQAFPRDIHSRHGFGCVDCHGGDKTTDDMDRSMSKARGFLGKIPRRDVPKVCARCHSDTNLIHRYKPQQRTDQLAQYQTSVHGKRLAAGDASVANCIDCHSVHDIREVRHALSPVHPLRLPETCAKCHADAGRMSKYKLDTHQFEQYRGSVHWDALSKRGDLSAPSCASCHGNHGATPPQVSSVAAVCGTCHVLLEDLYKKSPHEPVFAASGAGGCTVCHDNHGIKKPSSEMLAGQKSVCVQCHDATSAGGVAAAKMAEQLGKLSAALDRSEGILRRARESGMEVSEAQLKQIDARENLIKARVAVHAFRVAAVDKPVNDGLAIAAETYRAGQGALQEKDRRRIGLGVSLITIIVTLAGLALAIRAIEKRPEMNPAGR
jgi:predicted CXXCH cytochrome family protein